MFLDGTCEAAAGVPASVFPSTRYQGSKRKLAGAIIECLTDLAYESVLDAFGGTGAMAWRFKQLGKQVVYNDILSFNHQVGLALVENDRAAIDEGLIESIVTRRPERAYDDLISREFSGIYFTDEENRWLDVAVQNIAEMDDVYRRAVAWFALFQAALAKRPYNLFHRRNLYMRTARVERGFGNKATWDRSFTAHFRQYVAEAHRALIDSSGRCRALCGDALEVDEGPFDLVYIDPPYVRGSGVGVNYRDFYHFLEGMLDYPGWSARIDRGSRHRRLIRVDDAWSDRGRIGPALARLFERFCDSVLVVSYRSDGVPSIDDLAEMLGRVKRRVRVVDLARYKYVLSRNGSSREMVLIGEN